MHSIQIDDDIHDHLLRNVKTLGEDASAILRRLLRVQAVPTAAEPTTQTVARGLAQSVPVGAVAECLNNSRFHAERDVVGRFLFILGWLQSKHSDTFPRVLGLRGRRRTYFARSADELEQSGQSVNAQRIPASDFWVVTNNDNPKKKRILADVMRLLGYQLGDSNQMTNALE